MVRALSPEALIRLSEGGRDETRLGKIDEERKEMIGGVTLFKINLFFTFLFFLFSKNLDKRDDRLGVER